MKLVFSQNRLWQSCIMWVSDKTVSPIETDIVQSECALSVLNFNASNPWIILKCVCFLHTTPSTRFSDKQQLLAVTVGVSRSSTCASWWSDLLTLAEDALRTVSFSKHTLRIVFFRFVYNNSLPTCDNFVKPHVSSTKCQV